MKIVNSTFFLCLLFLLGSCSDNERECDRVCTEEYRTVLVKVMDSEEKPVALDDFEVISMKTGKDLSLRPSEDVFQLMRETGTYPVFSDKYVEEYAQQQVEVVFTGFINGEEVVSEIYTVRVDCCHVYHATGDLELVLTTQ